MKSILASLIACSVFAAAPIESKQDPDNTKKDIPALVMIDIQNFYFDGGYCPLEGSLAASENASKVLQTAREYGMKVFHIKHVGKFDPKHDPSTDPQYDFHELVTPAMCGQVINKTDVNSFHNTVLLESLNKLKANLVVIVGMQTHMCVEAAVRAATDYGFKVIVVTDATATRKLTFDGIEIPAAMVQASTLSTFKDGYGAKLMKADEFAKMFPPPEDSKH